MVSLLLYIRETLINCTAGRIAALRPRSSLAYLSDMSRVLAALRLALHPVITINQSLPNYQKVPSV